VTACYYVSFHLTVSQGDAKNIGEGEMLLGSVAAQSCVCDSAPESGLAEAYVPSPSENGLTPDAAPGDRAAALGLLRARGKAGAGECQRAAGDCKGEERTCCWAYNGGVAMSAPRIGLLGELESG